MPITEPFLFALSVATLSLLLFNAHLFMQRAVKNQTYYPLAVCFWAIAVVLCQPIVKVLAPDFMIPALILSLPALLCIAPGFWLYVKGLTSNARWQFTKTERAHFVLPAAGLIVAIIALLLPSDVKQGILMYGQDSILADAPAFVRKLTAAVLILTFALVLGWVIQSAFYLIKIIRQLHGYRKKLKDVFASTEQKELKWLTGLLFAVGIAWVITAGNLILDNLFFPTTFAGPFNNTVLLVMVSCVATWGLRQKPGFEELYQETEQQAAIGNEFEASTKYQRSALTSEHAQQIAAKIEYAMLQDKLYLDASLSLPKLARHIHTSANYISQTLNETLGMSFFDYVNKYRVDAAKQQLAHTDDTVLNIAMNVGFNSKSAFYSAFKKHTELTPHQFKKQACAGAGNTEG
ncbi:AraC family transcriptional regulator [Alkalimonas sp.]|uniref:helix-turn-helix domain-containing protein n=1 Tax=Alkalimonas sp. TaxID=1872453 RepID=UPI00263B51F4|nr:AraC family transcriptional regulator [Alkalimonas sp.]MCC5825915.1 helix-turn-helix transcriptional regulator [Alkalimonas sp.]